MKTFYLILAAFYLSGCASNAYQVPASAPNVKNETELAALEAEAKKQPNNLVLRAHIARQKEYLVDQLCSEAEVALMQNKFDQADEIYSRVLVINPASPRGGAGKLNVQMARRHIEWISQAEKLIDKNNLSEAELKLHEVLLEDASNLRAKSLLKKIAQKKEVTKGVSSPLRTSFNKPVTLEFREAAIRNIFEIISRVGNINFIFDKEVKADIKATIFVRNIRVEDAIKILLSTNQLEQKMLSENTILIYPNTSNKLKEYQELLVRSFYLANADVKQTANLIKTIAKSTDIHIDEKLNMLVIRDTPEVIRLVEKLIASQDMAEPEVMLEVEVLEVSRNKLQELGMRYPEQLSVSATGASASAKPGNLSIDEWKNLNSSSIRVSVTNPTFILNLRKVDTDTNLLANPRVRVRNREKAKIHIGERVPVITTTSTANVGVSESVTYLDVGLKLDIVPNIYLEDEVAMKVGLEVSNILETVVTPTGTQTYRLGTRNTETTLRLKNGETQVLAGLIQDDERKTANKVPGLGSLPLIGRLFSSNTDNRTKTEIVLLITPRVLRNIVQPEMDIAEFSSGTADAIGKLPISFNPVNPVNPGNAAGQPVTNNSTISQNLNPLADNPAATQQVLVPNLPKKASPVTIPAVPAISPTIPASSLTLEPAQSNVQP